MWNIRSLLAGNNTIGGSGENMSFDLITAIRQNHALEHATIAIIVKRLGMNVRLAGRATSTGFYLYGDIPTEAVTEAVEEGLNRLRKGEAELAISPFCGTNLAVTGILTGISAFITLRRKNRSRKLSDVITVTTIAALVAQPIGKLVQKYLTTSANLNETQIARIVRTGKGGRTIHRVETTWE